MRKKIGAWIGPNPGFFSLLQLEGFAVCALVHGRICFMCADGDTV